MQKEETNRLIEIRRHFYNRKIINVLLHLVEEFPELRFTQLLYILGYETKEDTFNEEPSITFDKIKKKYTDILIRHGKENKID